MKMRKKALKKTQILKNLTYGPLAKSDEEIFQLGKPLWENLVRSSNMKDYGGFTKDFSTQMLLSQ